MVKYIEVLLEINTTSLRSNITVVECVEVLVLSEINQIILRILILSLVMPADIKVRDNAFVTGALPLTQLQETQGYPKTIMPEKTALGGD